MGKCQDLLVGSKGLCFGAPELFQINEHHSLEVQSQDFERSLGLDNPAGPPPSAGFRLLADTSCHPSLSPRYLADANCFKVFSKFWARLAFSM